MLPKTCQCRLRLMQLRMERQRLEGILLQGEILLLEIYRQQPNRMQPLGSMPAPTNRPQKWRLFWNYPTRQLMPAMPHPSQPSRIRLIIIIRLLKALRQPNRRIWLLWGARDRQFSQLGMMSYNPHPFPSPRGRGVLASQTLELSYITGGRLAPTWGRGLPRKNA